MRLIHETQSLEAVRDCLEDFFRKRNSPTVVHIQEHERGVFYFGRYRQLTEESLEAIRQELGLEFEECDYYDEDRGALWVYVLK